MVTTHCKAADEGGDIVLNRLDWRLHKAGYRFARYADDFVVLCQDKRQAQEALDVVREVLENELGFFLSPEKTRITTYGKGFEFLGLNRVIRGRANDFATRFSSCRWKFQKLDSWIRMRLRCMKVKRKNYNDNRKLRLRFFRRKLGLLTLEQF